MSKPTDVIRDIDERGFSILRSIVDRETIDLALDDLARVFGLSRFIEPGFTAAVIEEFQTNNVRYRAKLREVRALLSISMLSSVLSESLRGAVSPTPTVPQLSAWPNLHLQHTELTFKTGYSKLPPHQEYHYNRGSIDSMVAWMPLFSIGPEHFPLEVVAYSHKNGLISHGFFGENAALETLDPKEFDDTLFSRLNLGVGDAVLFSSFAIHRTGAHGISSPKIPVRIAVNFQFNNLLERSILDRNYQLRPVATGQDSLFDPNPYISK